MNDRQSEGRSVGTDTKSAKVTSPRSRRFVWTTMPGIVTAAGTLILALATVALVVVTARGLDGGSGEGRPVGSSVEELVRATVQIRAVDEDNEPVWWGSGSVIRRDGLILTAGHLVDGRHDPEDQPPYDYLEIATTDQIHESPEWKYRASIVAADYALDLAVIKIDKDIDGNPVMDVNLPFVKVGDSGAVEILDEIRILGYPDTGGETLTATSGKVSGFTEERGIGERAWIKTDAAITGGASGGMGVNSGGELIAVPVQFGSGSLQSELVDCREFVADTNGDGLIDEADACVTLGGFINALRPINLAKRLIEQGPDYKPRPSQGEAQPASGYDPTEVAFENLVFSDGVTPDDLPTQVLVSVPSQAKSVCGFWGYQGMVDGMRWDAVWYVDGNRDEDASLAKHTWEQGASGNSLVCIEKDSGLPDGLYELALAAEGTLILADAIFVGGDHPLAQFSIENRSSKTICEVYLSPSGAQQGWGNDDLGTGGEIARGETRVLEVPAGLYDMLLNDCNGQELHSEYGLEVAGRYSVIFPVE